MPHHTIMFLSAQFLLLIAQICSVSTNHSERNGSTDSLNGSPPEFECPTSLGKHTNMSTRKYFRRTIQERKRLLEKYDQLPPMSQKAAARVLNVSGSLLCTWLRKRNIKNAKSNLPRTVSYGTPRVEAALWRWIDTSLENGISLNDSIIRKKATQVAAEMGLCNFWASSEWLARFKAREAVIREMFPVDRKEGDAPKEHKCGHEAEGPKKTLTARKTHRIEAALWRWIDHSYESGIDINESTIRFKAARLARTVGFHNFRATTDWFTRFKVREGVIRAMFQISRNSRSEKLTPDTMVTLVPRKDFTSTRTRQLEGALWRWIDLSLENGVTVNDSMIRSEASRLARMMGFSNFRSNGVWLKHFKTRERVVREMLQCSESPPKGQSEGESLSRHMRVRRQSDRVQSNALSYAFMDLDIPRLKPTVVTAELNGNLHTVTVPSLWQMKEAMKTLATGLLYRGFCDFNLLHQFEKEVEHVLRRSVILGRRNSFEA